MEIKVCVVEDEKFFSDHLVTLLNRWETENNVKLEISVFESKKAFEEKQSMDYQLIFMDIQLKDGTGMEIARNLREHGYKDEIVFVTSYQNYVFEGYEVRALRFCMKPIEYDKLDSCMQYMKKRQANLYYVYKHYDEVFKIPYRDILYFSSANQYTEIHTAKAVYRKAEPLKNILSSLPKQFFQCHRTLIVNGDCVEQFRKNELILENQETLPIGRKFSKNIFEFLKYIVSGI